MKYNFNNQNGECMKIHVVEPLAIPGEKVEQLIGHFKSSGHELIYFDERTVDPETLIERSRGAQIVVIANCPFPAKVINSLPDLQYLCVAFTGVDHVHMESCSRRGIAVSNASGYSNINVAELAVGLMIDILRNISRLDPVTRQGGTKEGLVGFDLAGKTIGIIGTGAIGSRVARILQGFDVNILAYDVYRNKRVEELGAAYCELDQLLHLSDIVTLHCPLNSETEGLIDYDKLTSMKKTSYLINCARGPVVNTGDLVKALNEGVIAGAAIDVFDGEPPLPTDNPLFPIKNTVLTPHIAFATHEAFMRRADIVRKNIDQWIKGSPVNLIG